MKKLVTLALVLVSAQAFATRSRVSALQMAPQVVEDATVYGNAADVHALGDMVVIESGKTNLAPGTDSVDQGAEGLLIRSMGDAKFAIGLGHDNSTIYANRDKAGVTRGQQNPVNLMYAMKAGDMAVGFNLGYSNYNDKVATEKESSLTAGVGFRTSGWYAALNGIFGDKWSNSTTEYKGATGIAVSAGMNMTETFSLHAAVDTNGWKTGATADQSNMTTSLTAMNAMKKDAAYFFYGAGLQMTSGKEKVADVKTSTLSLPVVMGLEAEANSWLTLRGSVKQDVILSNSKTTSGSLTTAEKAPGGNTTSFAAGAGLKFNKVSVDGSILASGGQKINGTDLLGTVGLTYNF